CTSTCPAIHSDRFPCRSFHLGQHSAAQLSILLRRLFRVLDVRFTEPFPLQPWQKTPWLTPRARRRSKYEPQLSHLAMRREYGRLSSPANQYIAPRCPKRSKASME